MFKALPGLRNELEAAISSEILICNCMLPFVIDMTHAIELIIRVEIVGSLVS